jgi:hypothetical protein
MTLTGSEGVSWFLLGGPDWIKQVWGNTQVNFEILMNIETVERGWLFTKLL